MKSLKSTLTILAFVTLGFGCASVTDAGLNDELAEEPTVEQTLPPQTVFGGNDKMEGSKSGMEKPK